MRSTLPIPKRDYSRQDKLQTAICCCHQQAHSSIEGLSHVDSAQAEYLNTAQLVEQTNPA
jgi:hypothetical protein